MRDKRDTYLILDPSGIYMVRICIPYYMAQYFGGKKHFMRSSSSKDIRQARLFRDAIAVEFNRLREQLKPKSPGTKMEQILTELRGIRSLAKDAPLPIGSSITRCPTLNQLRDLYLLQYAEKRKLTTLAKVTKAVELLLKHLRIKDSALSAINRTLVTDWLDSMKDEKATQTQQNYISALAQLYDYARNRYHDAPKDNPFRGHRLEAKETTVSYEPFTDAELAKVVSLLDAEMKAVTLIALYSGMRLNEICSLTTDKLKMVEGILCMEVTEGKTKSAARLVPVHHKLTGLIASLSENQHSGFLFYHASITNRADGKRSTWHTQRFTRIKRKAFGNGEQYQHKVFHSLRGMFITQLDRAKVPEDRIALMVGHERGNTESFKTYSQGASLKELSDYVNLVEYKTIKTN
ncbi:site-specific integrase [Hafnia alvei]|uniref:site-specific integrase n=1 Tax=Hafnia alvei TaxID=569 RepID=UPI0010351BD6|nr:site-specific integrase [Hafnia alvei]TBM08659.1 site-specific integrase [Hafnia alvei]